MYLLAVGKALQHEKQKLKEVIPADGVKEIS